MIELYDNDSGAVIGAISPEDLHFLVDQLEEESLEDHDYYIDLGTLDWFEDHGASADLLTLLRGALGDRDGLEIRWARELVPEPDSDAE